MRGRRKAKTKAWVPLGEPIHGFDNDNGTTPADERAEGDRHDRDVQDLLAKGFASNAASMGVTGGGF